jgi:uncharacterized glyoxalase superfamily protein PhnB
MTKPSIISPVSVHLTVANVERSASFYRDVLGFEVGPVRESYGARTDTEVVSGPARIQLGPSDNGKRLTPAIIFFETNDVAAMRDTIRSRGGAPSELQRVNWIKMEMFEIRDPDGHALWFGKSFHEEPTIEQHTPPGTGQLRQILPELPLKDVPAGVAHYRDVLGFSINYQQQDLGVMYRDSVTLLLVQKTPDRHSIGSCYVYIRDADALHAELVAKGANVQGEPVSKPWGLRDFAVLDLEGNCITFGQTFE